MTFQTTLTNYKKLIKFLIIGSINTLLGYTVYALFIINNVDYKIAITIATIIGVIFNYISTGRFVFRYSGFDRIIPFILTYIVTYLINLLLVSFLLVFGLSELFSGAIALVPVSILTFYLLSKHVYYR